MADPDLARKATSRFEPILRTKLTTCNVCKHFVVDPCVSNCYCKHTICAGCTAVKNSCSDCYANIVPSLCNKFCGEKLAQYWRTEGRCSDCPFQGTAKDFLTHDCFGTTQHELRPTKKHLADAAASSTAIVVGPPSRSVAAAAAAAYGEDEEYSNSSSSSRGVGSYGTTSSASSGFASAAVSPSLTFVESVTTELRRSATNFKDGRPPPKSAFVADKPSDAPLVVSLPWLGYAAHLAQQAIDTALVAANSKAASSAPAAENDAKKTRDDVAVALARFAGRLADATRELAEGQARATPPLKTFPTYHAEGCVKALAVKALEAWKAKELRALDAAVSPAVAVADESAAVAEAAPVGEDEAAAAAAAAASAAATTAVTTPPPTWRELLPPAVHRGVVAWIASFFAVNDAVCRASRVSAADGCLDLVVHPGAGAPKLVQRAQLRALLAELQLACHKRDCSVQPGERAIAKAAAVPRAWFERLVEVLEHCRGGDASVVVDAGVEIPPIPTLDIMAFDPATSLATVVAADDSRVVTLPEHIFNALWMRVGGGPKLLIPGTLDAADRIAAIQAPACALRVYVSIDAAKDAAAAKLHGSGVLATVDLEVPPHMLLADVVCSLPDAVRRAAGRSPLPPAVERALLYVLGASVYDRDPVAAAAAAANSGGGMLGALLNRGATAEPAPVAFKVLTDTAADAVAAQSAATRKDGASAEVLDATPLWVVLTNVTDALTTTNSGFYSTTTTTQLRGVIGLTNLGNTCFMNSGLQCLSNLPFLREAMLRCAASRFAAPSTTPVASAFINMLRHMWAEPRASFSPNEIKSAIGAKVRRFAGYDQQDAIELVGEILDKAHDELNPVVRKCYKERTDRDAEVPEPELSRQYWDDYLHNNESPVSRAFAHQVRTRLECLTCGKINIVFDAQTTLAVSIEQHNFTIHDIDVYLFSSVIVPNAATAATAAAATAAAQPAGSDVTADLLPATLLPAVAPRRLTLRLRVQSDAPASVLQTELRRVLADDPSVPPGLADTVTLLNVYNASSAVTAPTLGQPPYSGSLLFAAGSASVRPVAAIIAAAEKADEEQAKASSSSHNSGYGYSYREKPATIVLRKWARLMFYLPGAINSQPIHFEYVPFVPDKIPDAAQRIAQAILPDMLEPIPAANNEDEAAAPAVTTADAVAAAPAAVATGAKTKIDDSDDDDDESSAAAKPAATATVTTTVPVFGATGSTTTTTTSVVNSAGFAVGSSAEAAAAKKTKGVGPFGIWVEKKEFYATSYATQWSTAEYAYNHVGLHFDATKFRLKAAFRAAPPSPPAATASTTATAPTSSSSLPPIRGAAAAAAQVPVPPQLAPELHRSLSTLPSNAELKKQQDAQGMLTLNRCLEALRETHLLKGDDAWFCPRCREHREATMEQQIYVPPRCLTVHFKRFKAASHGYLMNKIDTPVAFPLLLDLAPFMSEHPAREAAARGETTYALRGVVNHMGSLGGGHYTAAAYAELHKSWATFDDSHAHLTSEPPRPDRAYILFYELLPSGAPPLEGHTGTAASTTTTTAANSNVSGATARINKLSSELD